jgi:hypothetical protein
MYIEDLPMQSLADARSGGCVASCYYFSLPFLDPEKNIKIFLLPSCVKKPLLEPEFFYPLPFT